jgi:Arc/MetJ family transcription regulator
VCINTEFMCIGGEMRTNIVIDDELMTSAIQATGLKTKREAVEQGLKLLVQQGQQKKIRKLRGKLSWEGDLDQMRGSNDSRRY